MKREPELLSNGKTALPWSENEKPELNHRYQCSALPLDYWKIVKDFHDQEIGTTYYKIIEYYNGETLAVGETLMGCREIIRDHTYRVVF